MSQDGWEGLGGDAPGNILFDEGEGVIHRAVECFEYLADEGLGADIRSSKVEPPSDAQYYVCQTKAGRLPCCSLFLTLTICDGKITEIRDPHSVDELRLVACERLQIGRVASYTCVLDVTDDNPSPCR